MGPQTQPPHTHTHTHKRKQGRLLFRYGMCTYFFLFFLKLSFVVVVIIHPNKQKGKPLLLIRGLESLQPRNLLDPSSKPCIGSRRKSAKGGSSKPTSIARTHTRRKLWLVSACPPPLPAPPSSSPKRPHPHPHTHECIRTSFPPQPPEEERDEKKEGGQRSAPPSCSPLPSTPPLNMYTHGRTPSPSHHHRERDNAPARSLLPLDHHPPVAPRRPLDQHGRALLLHLVVGARRRAPRLGLVGDGDDRHHGRQAPARIEEVLALALVTLEGGWGRQRKGCMCVGGSGG